MSGGGHLKVSVYFGERDRVDGGGLWDVLMARALEAGVDTAVLLRGVLGFGVKHRLRTDRVLTLSEDLPMVLVAVAPTGAAQKLAAETARLLPGGMVLLERVVPVTGAAFPDLGEEVKLTLYCAHGAVDATDALRAAGLDGAVVFAGLDGVMDGERRRPRLFAPAAGVPAMVVSMGPRDRVLDALAHRPPGCVATLERVRVLKRDGLARAQPPATPSEDAGGLGLWQRFTVIAGERDLHGTVPVHDALVGALRRAGAAGATALRGVWGFSHAGPPHGDRMFALRRRTPTLVTFIERPALVARMWPLIDEATREAGLVTCETVPAVHAVGPGRSTGGLRLAIPPA